MSNFNLVDRHAGLNAYEPEASASLTVTSSMATMDTIAKEWNDAINQAETKLADLARQRGKALVNYLARKFNAGFT